MAEAVAVKVESRDPAKNKGTGTRVARRLRAAGRIPAIVYGHKETPQPISLARDDVWQMIKNHTHLANLKLGDTTQMVIVRELQRDHLGKEVVHLDFARVSADESIETEVPLELHGTAPGTAEGGVLEFLVHQISVTCRAIAIPDSIRVEIGELHLNQGIHIRDLKLPEGVVANDDPDRLLVHVVTRVVAAEPTPEAAAAAAEPELIGRKPDEKGEEKDEKESKDKDKDKEKKK
jgi:large subunit ribosomal protein L25